MTQENNDKTKDKLRIQRTKEGTIFEIVTAILTVILWIIAIALYNKMPDTVPTHFNLSGEADGFGSKSIVFILAGLNTLVAILLLTTAYYPQTQIRTPFRIRNNRQYVPLIRMVRCLAVVCSILLIGIVIRISGNPVGTYLFTAALILLFVVCIFFNIQAYRLRK